MREMFQSAAGVETLKIWPDSFFLAARRVPRSALLLAKSRTMDMNIICLPCTPILWQF